MIFRLKNLKVNFKYKNTVFTFVSNGRTPSEKWPEEFWTTYLKILKYCLKKKSNKIWIRRFMTLLLNTLYINIWLVKSTGKIMRRNWTINKLKSKFLVFWKANGLWLYISNNKFIWKNTDGENGWKFEFSLVSKTGEKML